MKNLVVCWLRNGKKFKGNLVNALDIFATLKSVYENSDDKIMLADADMNPIWNNGRGVPCDFDKRRIKLYGGEPLSLPLETEETAEYTGEFSQLCALKIHPLKEQNWIIGYLMHFFDCEDIEIIADRSGLLKFKSNFLGNIRIEMGQIINMLDSQKSKYSESGDLDYLMFDKEARYAILKALSATVNYSELSRYYNGYFHRSFMNISVALEELCSELSELTEQNGVELNCEIEPAIYLEMNSERLKAAVSNLVVNGIIYNSKEEKKLAVTLKYVEDEIVLLVEDNGDGIDKETAERAKKPFANFNGYGQREYLGIAVASKCCEYFGGRLEFISEENLYTQAKMIFKKPDKDIPLAFRKNPFPDIPNPYDAVNSILSKAINPF